jgi:hypothetical protein
MESSSKASPEAVAALAGFVQVISRPASRKAFHADPLKALEKAKVNADHIPSDVLDHLSGLSLEELRLVSQLNSTLVGSGMKTITDGGSVAIL